MLSKDEEFLLESCISTIKKDICEKTETDLSHEILLWLATKLKELNEELKGSCNGEERHRHFSLDKREYFYHTHPHPSRNSVDYNIFHHHQPSDHRKTNAKN